VENSSQEINVFEIFSEEKVLQYLYRQQLHFLYWSSFSYASLSLSSMHLQITMTMTMTKTIIIYYYYHCFCYFYYCYYCWQEFRFHYKVI